MLIPTPAQNAPTSASQSPNVKPKLRPALFGCGLLPFAGGVLFRGLGATDSPRDRATRVRRAPRSEKENTKSEGRCREDASPVGGGNPRIDTDLRFGRDMRDFKGKEINDSASSRLCHSLRKLAENRARRGQDLKMLVMK